MKKLIQQIHLIKEAKNQRLLNHHFLLSRFHQLLIINKSFIKKELLNRETREFTKLKTYYYEKKYLFNCCFCGNGMFRT